MPDNTPITSSEFFFDFEAFDRYPQELYEWDDFMKYFPMMGGSFDMHPILWKIYEYQEKTTKEYN